MKHITLIATGTIVLVALMTFIGINIWQSAFTAKNNSKSELITKTIYVPRYDLGGSRKSSRPPFTLNVLIESPVKTSMTDIVKN